MDKCSIKRNNLFDVTVEAIIDFMNDFRKIKLHKQKGLKAKTCQALG
jgi:hypothetical protein